MGKRDNNSNTNGTSSTSPTTERKQIKSLTHHPTYYLIGGDLFIMIGTTIFKIHSYFFRREAKSFYSKLDADPTSPGDDSTKGHSENTAIIIETATVQEFEHFLWVFYNPLYDIYNAEIGDWFTILRLAHEWDFPQVKRFALRELKRREDEVPLVQRIVLYRDYKAPLEYLVPLYAQLCSRPQSPTDEEVGLLGMDETLKIFRARERVRAEDGSLSPLPKGRKEADTYPTIASVLGLPEYNWERENGPLDELEVEGSSGLKNFGKTGRKNSNGRTSSSGGGLANGSHFAWETL